MTGATRWPGTCRVIALAATPTFAVMAALSSEQGGIANLCSAATGMPLGDMTLMYLLMSVFHAPPWVGLFSRSMSSRRPGLFRTSP